MDLWLKGAARSRASASAIHGAAVPDPAMRDRAPGDDHRVARRVGFAALLALFVVACLGSPAVAGHAKPAKLKVSVAPSGATIVIKAKGQPKANCSLSVSASGKKAQMPRTRSDAKGRAKFVWGVPGDAPSGTWTFTVTCKRGRQSQVGKAKALIVTPANGDGTLLESSSLNPQVPGESDTAQTATVEIGGRGGAGDPGDDYPAVWKNARQDSLLDNWRMYNRECVSFVAWALASRNGFNIPFHDNANRWGPQARARGYRVDSSPAAGSVAWSNAGSYGHVAYVQDVVGGRVHIEEYNRAGTGRYSQRTVPTSTFTGYIHFADRVDDTGGGSTGGGQTTTPAQGHVSGHHYVYSRGSDGAVHIMFWNGSSWQDQRLGGSMAAGTTPSAYTAANGNHYVYFHGTDGAVHIMYWNGSSWNDQTLGGSMADGASPSGYTREDGKYHYVYFRGSDGAVHIMFWNGSSWQDQTLGGSVAAGSDPSAY
jgi:surface antigen